MATRRKPQPRRPPPKTKKPKREVYGVLREYEIDDHTVIVFEALKKEKGDD